MRLLGPTPGLPSDLVEAFYGEARGAKGRGGLDEGRKHSREFPANAQAISVRMGRHLSRDPGRR